MVTLVAVLVLAGCGADDDPGATPPIGDTPGDGPTTSEDPHAEDDAAPSEPDPQQDPVEDDVSPDELPDGPRTEDDAATDDAAANGADALLGAEVEAVLAELADDGIDPSDVELTVTELVTWPDGALGCPQPGMMYTQALVEGYRIVVEVDGDEIAYHGAQGGEPSRCDDPRPPVDRR